MSSAAKLLLHKHIILFRLYWLINDQLTDCLYLYSTIFKNYEVLGNELDQIMLRICTNISQWIPLFIYTYNVPVKKIIKIIKCDNIFSKNKKNHGTWIDVVSVIWTCSILEVEAHLLLYLAQNIWPKSMTLVNLLSLINFLLLHCSISISKKNTTKASFT